MNLKGLHLAEVAEIQEAVTEELKKFQNEEFSAASQKLYDRAKACIYANGAYFEYKKACVFLMCLRFLKESLLKLFDRTVSNTDRIRVTGKSRSTEGKFIPVSPFPPEI